VRSTGTTRVYADYAAGAPLRPAAARALTDALASGAGNASSVHREGARARALLESAREEIAAALGARPLEIVFTSGATEANNLALAGVAAAAGRPLRIAVPATEHSSVRRPAEALAAQGHEPCVLPVAADGRTDPEVVVALRPHLLSVAVVNAETGVLQPCAELAAAARRAGALVHLDAAQATTLALDVRSLDVDLMTLSGHKLGGPAGTGALYVRSGTPLAPLHHGGAQEGGLRAGTENVAALAAFATAVAAARVGLAAEGARLATLTARLRSGLLSAAPRARIAGEAAPRAPHLLDVGFPGFVGEAVVSAFDLAGVAVSAGSACAAGASTPSHVLCAMGWGRADAASAVRFSFGWASTPADVERILEILPGIVAGAATGSQENTWAADAS
jgi:cysteine desulfurase